MNLIKHYKILLHDIKSTRYICKNVNSYGKVAIPEVQRYYYERSGLKVL